MRRDPRDGLLPSVTTILGSFPKEWLGPWAAKLTAIEAVTNRPAWTDLGDEDAIAYLKGTPFRKRDAAAEHGTVVHEKADALHKGAEGTGSLEEEIEQEFVVRYGVTVERSEFCVLSRTYGYAGTGDLLAQIKGERWLIDRKTSGQISEEYELQQAAYAYAELIVEGEAKSIYRQHWYAPDAPVLAVLPPIERVGILWIPREHPEDWQLVELRAGKPEFDAFLAVKHVFDWRRYHKSQPEPAEVPAPQEEAA